MKTVYASSGDPGWVLLVADDMTADQIRALFSRTDDAYVRSNANWVKEFWAQAKEMDLEMHIYALRKVDEEVVLEDE